MRSKSQNENVSQPFSGVDQSYPSCFCGFNLLKVTITLIDLELESWSSQSYFTILKSNKYLLSTFLHTSWLATLKSCKVRLQITDWTSQNLNSKIFHFIPSLCLFRTESGMKGWYLHKYWDLPTSLWKGCILIREIYHHSFFKPRLFYCLWELWFIELFS